jgi:alkylation response protein AidB-like acyl-CoA dehydrogenase
VADLSFTSEQEILRTTARDVLERECPLSEVRRIIEMEGGFSLELWRKTASLGWQGLLVPERYGGEGGTLTDAAVLFEELGRALLPGPYLASGVLGALLLQAAPDGVRERLLPSLARGQRIVALALTEADYGWTPEHVRTNAAARGDGLAMSGTKRFVPDAGAAHDLIVAARDGDGVVLCLVDAAAPGVERRPMAGFSGAPLCEIELRDVVVTRDAVIGGWDALEPALDRATALLCAYMAGATRRVYEMSLDYAQRRVQFGQPIARFQRVQDRLIDILNAADGARWTAYEAFWKLENDRPDAQAAVSVAKAVAGEGLYQACEDAHHVHAGIGSDKAYGLYLYTMASRSLYHHLGAPAHHRRRLARLLGLS